MRLPRATFLTLAKTATGGSAIPIPVFKSPARTEKTVLTEKMAKTVRTASTEPMARMGQMEKMDKTAPTDVALKMQRSMRKATLF